MRPLHQLRFFLNSGSGMQVTRKTLLQSEALQIGLFEGRPVNDACGDVERQHVNAMVLPLSGVFSKHDAPARYVIGTPSHAVFFAAQAPYRIGYPGAIGDRALTLHFAGTPAELEDCRKGEALPSHGLLDPGAMVLRNLLWRRLHEDTSETLEIENLGLELLAMSLGAIRLDRDLPRRTPARRIRALERVKEAVALAPADKWDIARLAGIASLSPFHLCRVFRQMTGTSVYDYVLRERLAQALDAIAEGANDLTAVALDAGFASHSHFTARFRAFFGCTPAAFRQTARAGRLSELRKIMTAQRSHSA
jgi:AraC-like DNA-binding protein